MSVLRKMGLRVPPAMRIAESLFVVLFIVPVICSPAGGHIPSQDVDVRAFNKKDGLPHEVVRDVVEGPDGSIWFATWGGGVTCCNGQEWRTFDETDGVPNNAVRCLLVNRNEQFWIGTREGIGFYNGQNWIAVEPDIPGLATPSVFCLLERSDGSVWFGCENETILQWSPASLPESTALAETASPEKGTWSVVLSAGQDIPHNVRDMIEMDNGEVWVGLDKKGIIAWNGESWYSPLKLSDPNQKVYSLCKTPGGIVWAAGGSNLHQFGGETWRLLEETSTDAVCIDSSLSGDLYVGTREGLCIHEGAEWLSVELGTQIPYPRVECVKCFDDGTVWVGTENGAYRVTPRPWTTYTQTIDGIELIGRYFYADPQTPPLTVDRLERLVQFDGEEWRPIASLAEADVKAGEITRPVNGRIWIRAVDCVIQFSLLKHEVLRKVALPQNLLATRLFQSREGDIYLLSKTGIYQMVGDSWEPRPKTSAYNRTEAYGMQEDKHGRLWVELEDRVECWIGDRIEVFFPREERTPTNRICAIACGDDGTMWFGTNGSGVISWDGETFRRHTTKDGILSDVVIPLYEDSRGVLWAGTNYMGLSSYQDKQWVTFAFEEGLKGRGAMAIGEYPAGTVWIGVGPVGAARYTPRRGNPDTFIHESPFTIPSGEQGVFTFAGRDKWKLSRKEDLVFSWRIYPKGEKPNDFDWSPFSSQTALNSPPLESGNYTFEVRTADIDRNVDPTPARINFEVLLPIWRTPQFLAVALIAGVAALLLSQKHIALGRSEKKYRDLVESINDVIYITDRSAHLDYVSPAIHSYAGYSPSELIGKIGFDYIHAEDVAQVKDRFHKILAGETLTHEYRIRTKDGQVRWMHDSCRPHIVRDQVIGVAGVLTDIHARKKAEQALQEANAELEQRVKMRTRELEEANRVLQQQIIERQRAEEDLRKSKEALEESEKRFRGIVETTSAGYCHIDAEGLFRYVNDSWLKMHKYSSRDEVIGKHNSIVDLPEEKKTIENRVKEILEKGIVMSGEARRFCKDGSIGHHIFSANPVTRDGRVVGIDGFLIDTTERRRAEAALEQSEERFRAQYKAIPVPTYTWKGTGDDLILVDYNHAAEGITEGKIADYIGITATELYGTSSPDIVEKLMRCYTTHEKIQEEIRYRYQSTNQEKYLAVTYVFVPPDLVVAHTEDVTERREAEEHIHALTHQLMKSQESERQRISRDLHDNVAQDLSIVKIRLDTLFNNHVQLPQEIKEDTEELSETLHRSIMAVRDLSYHLRPSGLDQLGLIPTLHQFCGEFSAHSAIAVDFYSAGIEYLDIDFDTKINIYRLIQEALNNTRRHAEAKQVVIRLVASYPKIILRIEDNGRGFDVQSRLNAASREKRMGLRSMEERVNLLEGKMRIRSSPGEGTKILIEVPYREEYDAEKENSVDRR